MPCSRSGCRAGVGRRRRRAGCQLDDDLVVGGVPVVLRPLRDGVVAGGDQGACPPPRTGSPALAGQVPALQPGATMLREVLTLPVRLRRYDSAVMTAQSYAMTTGCRTNGCDWLGFEL